MSKDMPMEVWAADNHITVENTIKIGLFVSRKPSGACTSYTLTSYHTAEIEALQAENARLREALDGLLSCYINPQAHKTPTASDIAKYRNSVIKAKQALGAPIEKTTTENQHGT